MIALIIAALFACCYFTIQLFYLLQWQRVPVVVQSRSFVPELKFSIVVVAHNEENSIVNCIESLLQQHYPSTLFEIIIINDRSSDQTVHEILSRPSSQIKLLHLQDHPSFIHPPAYKKSGIELAVHHAQNDWIITTDADCIHHPEWLRTISIYVSENQIVFATAPVLLQGNSSLLHKMQVMENITLMLITASGIRSGLHDMANGANMCFSKKMFEQIRGYQGNYQFASGDDMFLIEKMRLAAPDQIGFIKALSAIVTTSPKSTWKGLIQQRIRWAGKNAGLQNKTIQRIWLFVVTYHLLMVLFLILPLATSISFISFVIMLVVKWGIDGLIVFHVARFFGLRFTIPEFIKLQCVYTYYLLLLGVNIMLKRKDDWAL
ncbi:MAG: glycosyltransferase [Bacteroidota bacterium]|nr:glycosyltransferase [Bacteroidota bacterium]